MTETHPTAADGSPNPTQPRATDPGTSDGATTIPFETLDAEAAQAPGSSSQDTMTKLQAELSEMKDRWVRTEAELDNARRRHRRDLDEERRYAVLPLAKDLLPVLDNLGRAVEAARQATAPTDATSPDASETAKQDEAVRGLIVGVEMVLAQAKGILAQHKIEVIPAIGQTFDANIHDAIAQERSEQPRGTITREAATGYRLHDRVIRPAVVVVSQGEA